jgi:hypothetical protein
MLASSKNANNDIYYLKTCFNTKCVGYDVFAYKVTHRQFLKLRVTESVLFLSPKGFIICDGKLKLVTIWPEYLCLVQMVKNKIT